MKLASMMIETAPHNDENLIPQSSMTMILFISVSYPQAFGIKTQILILAKDNPNQLLLRLPPNAKKMTNASRHDIKPIHNQLMQAENIFLI